MVIGNMLDLVPRRVSHSKDWALSYMEWRAALVILRALRK